MANKYTPLYTPPRAREEPALWFAFQGSQIVVLNGTDHDQPVVPCCVDLSEHGISPLRNQYLGLYGGRHCYAVEIHQAQPLPQGWSLLGLRDLFGLVEATLAALSGRAYQIIDWDRNHQYCRISRPRVTRIMMAGDIGG